MKRSISMKQGLTRYFTGKPCKNGHIAERNTSDGRCCECAKLKSRFQYAKNSEKLRKEAAERRRADPEKAKDASRRYKAKHREKVLREKREYWKRNKEKRIASDAKKRATKLQATPPWFGELDAFVWDEAAHLVRLREAATGIKWHADHMIPLRCKKASGLHVAANVQVIPAKLNIRKSNRLVLSDRNEWVRFL